jgi:molecular chaperone DnaK (HSP70)
MSIVVKPSPFVMGIDLGTTNSAIAVYEKGESKIVPIDGDKVCPSVMNVREDGEIVVGRHARSRFMIDPDNTVASAKREIGGSTTWEFAGLPGKKYSPSDVAAEILSKLVLGAQQAGTVDLRGTPRYVVICIPANFNDAQKTATKEAAALANLEVLWLLEEPEAAAIAYAVDKDRDQTVLVYDLGGGTFDVSILKVESSKDGSAEFSVLAKAGVPKLGGDDFDQKIMEIAAAQLKTEADLDILDLKKDQGISTKALREAQQKLKMAAQEAKHELTEALSAHITIPNIVKDESGNLHNLDIEITREAFDDAIRDLVRESRTAVETALAEAKLTIEDVSRIILVGGSTRVPLVKEMLKEMFGKEPYSDLDPDTVVARGAAIKGATLNVPDPEIAQEQEKFEGTITTEQIVTHFLGIEIVGGKFSCLLEKGAKIPPDTALATTKDFGTPRDDMTELAIRVYQSDRTTQFVGSEGIECIGEFFLTGIPAKPRGQERIHVTFEIDQQNLLRVEATSSNSSGDLEIQRESMGR